MRNLFEDFFSHKALFFGMFNEAGANIVEMAELLVKLTEIDLQEERDETINRINSLEEKGDNITHKVYLSLDKIVFTPLYRKDIHTLISAIDDVADHIHESAGRIRTYKLQKIIEPMKDIAQYILRSCTELNQLINSLDRKVQVDLMFNACKQIKKYEYQADLIYYRSLADLFANEKDPIELIKYRDILSSLETSTNKCKNVTDAIETILINR
jgi:predicted phosphate transport protein (TIGR00153 family)